MAGYGTTKLMFLLLLERQIWGGQPILRPTGSDPKVFLDSRKFY